MTPYISELPNYEAIIKNQQILLDSDAIISISEYGAIDIFNRFKDLHAILWTIDPVLLELFATDNPEKRIRRLSLKDLYEIGTLAFFKDPKKDKNPIEYANKVQAWLVSKRIFSASPSDLYLAGTLATYNNSSAKLYLLTSNLCDFPDPLFKRESYIILQNQKSSKLLTFLSFDSKVLEEIQI